MGRITLIAQLQSNIQAGLKAIQGAATQTGNAINGMGRRANAAMGQVNALGGALQNAQNRAAQAGQTLAQNTKTMNTHSITTGRLIVMMVKFGIILNALRVVTSPLGWIDQGVQSMLVLDRGMRNIVGMLANQSETSDQLDQRYRRLMLDATQIQVQYGQTAENTVTGLYKIASVVDSLNFTGVRKEVDHTSFAIEYLGNISAKAAVAGMTDMGTAADSLTAVLTGLNIPLANAQDVTDILFQTVRMGKAEFTDVARDVGVLAGAFSGITKQGREMQMLQETGGLYAFFTTFLPPEQARVSLQRMGLFLTGESKQAQELAAQLGEISGGKVKLTAGAVREQGLTETFRQIAGLMDPTNPQLRAYIQGRVGRPVTEEEMGGVRFRILTKIFDDARAARAALRVLGTDGTASLDQITASFGQFGGAMDRALGQGRASLQFRIDQLHETITATARSLVGSDMPGVADMFSGISDTLSQIMQRPAYQSTGFFGKLGFIFGGLYRAFSEWYYTGGGQQDIANMATQIGKDMGHFIMGVLGLNIKDAAEDGQFKNAWYDAGKSAGGNFLRGLLEALNPTTGPSTAPGPLAGAQNFISRGLGGPVTRFILGAAAARGLGGGGLAQTVVGGAAASSDNMLVDLAVTGLGLWSIFGGLRGGRTGGAGGLGTGITGLLRRTGASPLLAGLTGLKSSAGNALLNVATKPGSRIGAGLLSILNLANRFPVIGKVAGRVPVAGAAIQAASDIFGGQDPAYAIGHGLFVGAGGALGAAGAGLLGLPSGPGAILAAIAGGAAGGFGGDLLFKALFGPGRTPNQAAGAEQQRSIIDDYFESKRQAEGLQAAAGGLTVVIPIEKLADNITASTPQEAEQLADRVFGRIVERLEGFVGNTANATGGGGSALLTP